MIQVVFFFLTETYSFAYPGLLGICLPLATATGTNQVQLFHMSLFSASEFSLSSFNSPLWASRRLAGSFLPHNGHGGILLLF